MDFEIIRVDHYYASRYTKDLIVVLSVQPGRVKYRPLFWSTEMFTTEEVFHKTFLIHNP